MQPCFPTATGMGLVLGADFRLVFVKKLDVLSTGERVESLLGYKPRQFLTSQVSLESLLHPQDRAVVEGLFRTEANADAGSLAVRIRHADGRIRCLRMRYEREAMVKCGPLLRVAFDDPAASRENMQSALTLRAVLESLEECACVKDRDHVIVAANRNHRLLFPNASGWPEDLHGLTDYDLFPEAQADASYAREEKVLRGETGARVTFEALRKDGKKEWLDHRKFPVRDEQGQIIGLLTLVSVITEGILAEAALRESEQSLREAQKIAGIGSFTLNVVEQSWTGSEMLCEILGIEKSAKPELSEWSRFILEADMSRLVHLYGDMHLDRRKTLDWSMRFVRQNDREKRWGHIRARLELDSQGRQEILRGTIEDVTERMKAEGEVQESARLLETFIHDAPTGLAMFDREMRYIRASKRWIEDHGLQEWEVTGHRHFDLGYQVPDHWKEDYRRALAGEVVPPKEDSYENEDGSMRWVRRMARPWMAAKGEIGGIVVLSEDITAKKLAEEALRASEESLKEAQTIAGVGSYVLDFSTGLWKSSEALDALFGIDAGYFRTVEGWRALVHPEDREMMSSHLKDEVIGQAVNFGKEYRIVRRRDHAVRWVHGLGKLELDARGNPTFLRGTIQDITARKSAEGSLRESRELLQLFIQHVPAAIAMFDREMRYVSASRRWLEDYSLSGEDILGRSHYEVIPEIPERWKEFHRRGMAGESIRMEEDRFERADGRVQWLRWEIVPWRAVDGTVGGIVLFADDISALKANQERLKLAANVFTHASEGILITDAEGTILDANEAFTGITGYERSEVLGLNPRLLNSGRQSREFYAEMWAQLRAAGRWSGEIWNRAKNGQLYAEMLTISAVPGADGKTQQYVAMFSDITSIKEKEQQLKQVTHYDLLTGLPNRALLEDRLRQAMAHSHRLGYMMAVACLDLDNFSNVNDRHGHRSGDQMLTAVTQRMKDTLGEGDTLARLGGDEFAVVLLDLRSVEESLLRVAKLLKAAAEPVHLNELTVQGSASIGVTFFPQSEAVEPDQLLRQADQAMYYAKLAGKNRYHIFDPTLDRTMRGRHEDLNRMRVALEAREFELYYQPRVNMRSGAVLGVEALIRWNHPERGLLAPRQFLPVVNGNPLIVALGDWVLRSALAQVEEWRTQGLHLSVSVNVDALQLQQAGFVSGLQELLAEHPSIPASCLELEVLESSAVQDVAQVSEVIRACGKLGISFALDDFGTGYSSLAYLRRLPVDILKIDQTFVHDMLDDPEDLTILEGILGLAKAFRRQAVAEGVETIEHGLMLLHLGCPVGQGYGIARPMPARDLLNWMAEWRPDPRWVEAPALHEANWPLLYASVEHRAWINQVEEFITGRRHTATVIDPHHCRLGSWLDGEASAGRGESGDFREMEQWHQRLHGCANGLLQRTKEQGEQPESGALTELLRLRDGLIEKLQTLVAAH